MPRPLVITPAPFKSSYLAIPPSPFSPRLPITPPPNQSKFALPDRQAQLQASAKLLPPPTKPLHWLWQCHKCNRVYKLGVTRRCLDDGHFFCAGSTVVKKSKKSPGGRRVIRHPACASEFDYAGWKSWGVWRRMIAERVEDCERMIREEDGEDLERTMEESEWFGGKWSKSQATGSDGGGFKFGTTKRKKKDCWMKCDYPSECRWGRQFGVQTPVAPVFPVMATPSGHTISTVLEEEDITVAAVATSRTDDENAKAPKTTFEDILIDITDPDSLNYLEPLNPSASGFSTVSEEGKALTNGETKMTSVEDLVLSAQRRKRKSVSGIPLMPSPLSLNPPSPPEEEAKKAKVAKSIKVEAVKGDVSMDKMKTVTRKKAFDDLELEIKKRADSNSSSGHFDLAARASELVQGLKFAKAKFQAGAL